MFAKLMLRLAGIVVGMGVTIAVMIKGWGLEPKSWWWILGVYFFGHCFAILFIAAADLVAEK